MSSAPERLRIQGTVSLLSGQPVTGGFYDFEVKLFEDAVTQDALVTMTASGYVEAGAYSFLVAPDTPGALSQQIDLARYMEVRIDGPSGWELIMPRQELASVPHALNATQQAAPSGGANVMDVATTTATQNLGDDPVEVVVNGLQVEVLVPDDGVEYYIDVQYKIVVGHAAMDDAMVGDWVIQENCAGGDPPTWNPVQAHSPRLKPSGDGGGGGNMPLQQLVSDRYIKASVSAGALCQYRVVVSEAHSSPSSEDLFDGAVINIQNWEGTQTSWIIAEVKAKRSSP